MSLYAIGDLHLPGKEDKTMDMFGLAWYDHVNRLRDGFSVIKDDDLTVLCGDLSWGSTLDECLEDFAFINSLPGKKILLKGNHDYWWATKTKTKRFFTEHNLDTIEILSNNCFYFDGAAICGTRGWLNESKKTAEENLKIMNHEVLRLEMSLKSADPEAEKICFFHYPPRFNRIVCDGIINIMNKYGVKRCYYGHIHGNGHQYAVQGLVGGIEYTMISADYINFTPLKVI